MNLYLMRHAIALEANNVMEDNLRPLSEKGRKKLGEIVQNLKRLEINFDIILTSPYVRTRQTTDMLAEGLAIKQKNIFESENLCPPGFGDGLINEICAHDGLENILIVGHEPALSQLIGVLIAGDPDLDIEIKKAGLCKLSIDQLKYGRCAKLEWLLTPSQLIAIR
ncbi:MAG: phosphohistidine phosphatase SixA [Chloroflexota bacterium]